VVDGNNPYSLPDGIRAQVAAHQEFIYMPLMLAVYTPLGYWWGAHGVLATNLILDAVVVILLYFLGKHLSTYLAGLLAAFLYLASWLIPFELFQTGVVDLAAVIPLLIALLLFGKRPGWSGFLVGISIATKLFPGVIVLIALLPRKNWQQFLKGMLIGLIPIAVFLIISPIDFIASSVIWALIRPSDATSWLHGLSPVISLGLRLILLITFVATALYVWVRQPRQVVRLGLIVFLLLGMILSSSVNHRNYEVWWIPFYALLAAITVFGSKQGSQPTVKKSNK